jgi:hypothetical protein
MNVTTKSFRALASAALGLAMVASVGAGLASAEPVNVTLSADGNTCAVSLSGTSFEMGNYKWNGSAYVAQPGAGSATITGTVTATGAPGDRDCTVTIVSSDVTSGSNVAFTASQVMVEGIPASPAISLPIANVPLGGTTPQSGTVTLPGTTSAFVPAGNYSGTLTVTAAPTI